MLPILHHLIFENNVNYCKNNKKLKQIGYNLIFPHLNTQNIYPSLSNTFRVHSFAIIASLLFGKLQVSPPLEDPVNSLQITYSFYYFFLVSRVYLRLYETLHLYITARNNLNNLFIYLEQKDLHHLLAPFY